jgi:hypothetical protein
VTRAAPPWWTEKTGQKRTALAVLARLVKVLAPATVTMTGRT